MPTPVEDLATAFGVLSALVAARDGAIVARNDAAASMDLAIGPELATYQAASAVFQTADAVFQAALSQAKLDIDFASIEANVETTAAAYSAGVITFAEALQTFRDS